MRTWMLLVYNVPNKPTSGRLFVWRKLKKLGAMLLHDAVWVLPATPHTREQLRWLASEILELKGEATVWEARPALAADEHKLVARFVSAVERPYRQLLADLKRTRPGWSWGSDGTWPDPMARLSKMKSLAITADLLIGPTYVKNRHKNGVNVGYGDGSAHWVNLSDFHNVEWDKIKYDDFGPEHDDSLLNGKTNPASGVWAELDRH